MKIIKSNLTLCLSVVLIILVAIYVVLLLSNHLSLNIMENLENEPQVSKKDIN